MNKQSQEGNAKKISKIEKEIKRLNNFKVIASEVQTLKQLKEIEKENETMKVIKTIDLFLTDKKHNEKPKYKDYAPILKMHPQTFSKLVKHWEKFKELPVHKNTDKTPWNKLDFRTVEKVINGVNKILRMNEKFTNAKVPMSISWLYFFIKDELEKMAKEFNVSQITFYRIVNMDIKLLTSKFSWKIKRKINRKIIKLREKLQELKSEIIKTSIKLENKAIEAKVLADDRTRKTLNERPKVSPRRNECNAGECIQIDGSQDQFYKGKLITRMQAIDHKSLSTEAIYFVKNENNIRHQMILSQLIEKGIPKRIICDRRKGVDPTDEGALIAIICKLLKIEINAQSNSTHKAKLESLNGKMHPLVTTMAAKNQWKTVELMNQNLQEIKDMTNRYFKKKEVSYTHLRQVTPKQKAFLKGAIKQVRIMSTDGFIFNKKAYQVIAPKDVDPLKRFAWNLVLLKHGNPIAIWTEEGIFKLRRIAKELSLEIFAEDKALETGQKHFIDNGIMILNKETYLFVVKSSREQGFKDAIQHKLYMLDEQIKKKIKRKRELN